MLDSQPILIVGGTRGTGLLIAQRLLDEGCRVRVLARDPARAAARLGSATDVVPGDITRPDTLPAAVRGARDIIFTAGVRSGRPSREALIRTTEYDGVVNTLTTHLGRGQRTQGFITAIETCGKILAEHFPPGRIDQNELPNHLIVLDGRWTA